MTWSPTLAPPWLVAPATPADRPPIVPEPARVNGPRYVEVIARLSGGFVVDWELGGPTRAQQ